VSKCEQEDHDEEARAKWMAVTEGDWNAFVTNRCKELRKGGRIIVSVTGSCSPLDEVDLAMIREYKACLAAIQTTLAKFNLEECQKGMVMPSTSRTPDEMLKPFKELELDSRVVGLDTFALPEPTVVQFQKDNDGENLAQKKAGYSAGWTEGVLRRGLLDQGVEEEVVTACLKEYFEVTLVEKFREIENISEKINQHVLVIAKE